MASLIKPPEDLKLRRGEAIFKRYYRNMGKEAVNKGKGTMETWKGCRL